MSIEVRNIWKTFGNFNALRGVSLRVDDGELVALLGPSGSGKTTLLRIIAGLELPDPVAGSDVLFDGTPVTHLAVGQRGLGFVFQHYALFRHMSVFENVAFGLRVRPRRERPSNAEIRDRVNELLRLVQLSGYGDRYPSQLSGGQRQRVALARALAVEPRVLLLDEPFGALDARVRQELRAWLRSLHDQLHVTTVFVTHDQEEAFEVSDRVVVMRDGRVEQVGAPQDVFDHPATPFVMDFLGSVNVIRGRSEGGRVKFGDFAFDCESTDGRSTNVSAYVRPHEFEIAKLPVARPSLPARVLHVNSAGPIARVRVDSAEFGMVLNIDISREQFSELDLKPGDEVYVSPRHVRVFAEEDYAI